VWSVWLKGKIGFAHRPLDKWIGCLTRGCVNGQGLSVTVCLPCPNGYVIPNRLYSLRQIVNVLLDCWRRRGTNRVLHTCTEVTRERVQEVAQEVYKRTLPLGSHPSGNFVRLPGHLTTYLQEIQKLSKCTLPRCV